jgi:hypothetical protein
LFSSAIASSLLWRPAKFLEAIMPLLPLSCGEKIDPALRIQFQSCDNFCPKDDALNRDRLANRLWGLVYVHLIFALQQEISSLSIKEP